MTSVLLWKSSRKLIILFLTMITLTSTPVTSWAATEIGRPVLPGDDGINQGYLYGESTALHKGVDFLNVALGDAVLAAAPGMVVDFVESNNNGCEPTWPTTDPRYCNAYGNYVLVRHNQQHYDKVSGVTGWVYTLYMHLQNNGVLVNLNDNVVAGQQIGQGDDTGNSTANHLHFQLIIHDQANRVRSNIDSENRTRNPELWLKPLAGTARLAGKVTDGNGIATANLIIYGLQKAVGAVTLRPHVYQAKRNGQKETPEGR